MSLADIPGIEQEDIPNTDNRTAQQWKEMFDKINQDCLHNPESPGYIPYSNIDFYTEQIHNLDSYDKGLMEWETAQTIAQQMNIIDIQERLADLVIANNKENYQRYKEDCIIDEMPVCPFCDFGTYPETARIVLKDMFKEVANIVAKKQSLITI